MNLKEINDILAVITNPQALGLVTFVERIDNHLGVSDNSYADDGVEGEYDSYSMIYKINSQQNLYMKVTYNTDSYGSNEFIVSIKFVKKNEKKIKTYE